MVMRHPARALLTVVGAMVIFFLLSASGQPGTFWSSGPSWLGTLGWTAFLIGAVVLIGLCVYLAVHRLSAGRQIHRAR
jgi:protein-S-isoprenylcysteine O-methyltransferase Ste14